MSAFTPSAGLYLRFRSKIDAWLGGVVLLGILVSGAMAIGLLLQRGIASLAIVPVLAAGLALWLLIETRYDIADTDLIVHSGPFRTTVPISSIRMVRATRTLTSAYTWGGDEPGPRRPRARLCDRQGAPFVVARLRNGFLLYTDDPARTRRLFEEL